MKTLIRHWIAIASIAFLAALAVSINSASAAVLTWDGGGDGTSWNQAANWGGTAPAYFDTLNITTTDTITNVYRDTGTSKYQDGSTWRGVVNLNQGTVNIGARFETGSNGIFNIGDGAGTADSIVDVTGGYWRIDRHDNGTYTINVNQDGQLKATGGSFQPYGTHNNRKWEINVQSGSVSSSSAWNMSDGPGNDANRINISANGTVNVGAISVDEEIIDFVDNSGSFTAAYGGSFANIGAVNAAIGSTFTASGGGTLQAVDNGSSYTLSVQNVDLEPQGRLATSSGSLTGAAYAINNATGGTLWTDTTPWSIQRADSLTGPRTTLLTGTTVHGDASTDNPFTLPAGPNLDQGFESGGLGASSWTEISGGNGNNFAIMGTGSGYAGPRTGSYQLGLTNPGGRDGSHDLLHLRSEEFTLAAGDLNFYIQGGQGQGDLPTGMPGVDFTLSPTSSSTGYLGVALRDADTGEWLLTDRRSGNGNSWQLQGWTEAELASYVGDNVTLEIIDNDDSGWAWIGLDDFSIPFTPNPGIPLSFDPNSFYFLTVMGEEVFAGQIAIPEPSTFIFAALGLLGLVAFGRRRRQR